MGVMIESFLEEGRKDIVNNNPTTLVYHIEGGRGRVRVRRGMRRGRGRGRRGRGRGRRGRRQEREETGDGRNDRELLGGRTSGHRK
jgi:hypothetical protein